MVIDRKEVQGWLFASPYLIFTLVFFAIPVAWSIFLVFFEWNLISPQQTFVGLSNFAQALTSNRTVAAFLVTYKFLIIFVPTAMALSIGLALIIHHVPRFKQLFAVGFFMPYLASGVAMSQVVRGLISYNSPMNVFLRDTFGTSPDWLGDPWPATFVISAMLIWKLSGYYGLIFLAGLQGIPTVIYEAASLDGAGAWTKFWKITLPLLYPSFYTVLILAVGITFAIFTEPFVLTDGGPNLATHTWQLEIYYQAFERFQAGYGATVAVLNALVMFISILIVRRVVESWGARHGFEG